MKRTAFAHLLAMLLTGLVGFAAAQTQSDSLGDYARHARKEKKPVTVKQYDNDNLPKSDKLSVVGNATSTPPAGGQQNQNPTAVGAQNGAAQATDEWKAQIEQQKKGVDDAAHELDLLQREYRMRAAVMYADAGNRMRNQANWDKEDTDYKAKIAEKEKEVKEAREKLEDLQEQARKSGVPNSVRE